MKPFSVYQGKWNAECRDLEAEIVPMCQDQGLAIVTWASLGGGSLLSEEQRKQLADDPKARKAPINEQSIKISKVLENIARKYETTLQAVVSYRSNNSRPPHRFLTDDLRLWHTCTLKLPMSYPSSAFKQWPKLKPWKSTSRCSSQRRTFVLCTRQTRSILSFR